LFIILTIYYSKKMFLLGIVSFFNPQNVTSAK
jgi:hypothetical protein